MGVTEQNLDDADGHALLHQVRGKRMAERPWRNGLGDLGTAGGHFDGALNRGVANGAARVLHVREEKIGRIAGAPPLAEQGKSDGRERDVAILASLSLMNANEHAL